MSRFVAHSEMCTFWHLYSINTQQCKNNYLIFFYKLWNQSFLEWIIFKTNTPRPRNRDGSGQNHPRFDPTRGHFGQLDPTQAIFLWTRATRRNFFTNPKIFFSINVSKFSQNWLKKWEKTWPELDPNMILWTRTKIH